ncbi:hypothetical protein PRZ48_007476 [Zasmidium cellare]|uniref:Gamma-glutamyltransferase n=1 Tax=Zasmidium cellare TaxID=395010 RepID=A0ABR0EJF4_ZASCE|nr:hypothetical protein PRZ48_007476 [Zasmidium cellare]
MTAIEATGTQQTSRPSITDDEASRYLIPPGPKPTLRGLKATCSTGHPAVNEAIIKVLSDGGNAVDAAIAGCMVQAVVEQHLTNHTGTISLLYHEASTGTYHQLDSSGTFASGLAPFHANRPMGVDGRYVACIPGFMPGLKAMFERFVSRPWTLLCEDAIYWAEEGHFVTSQEYASHSSSIDWTTYYPEGRQHYMSDGFLTPVGYRHRQQLLADTLRRVAAEGPDYMIAGPWAEKFVRKGHKLDWNVTTDHMLETPPRWQGPMRLSYEEYEIVSLAAPQQQGVYLQMVLGIMRHLGIDLSEHVRLTRSPHGKTGYPTGLGKEKWPSPSTCEVSVIDQHGNGVQMTHTFQTNGIPGMVIDGVPMRGSSAQSTGFGPGSDAKILAGCRMRRALGSTFVLKDGKPIYQLGNPGWVLFTIPQVLHNLLDFKMEPFEAVDAPRLFPLQEHGSVTVEDRSYRQDCHRRVERTRPWC